MASRPPLFVEHRGQGARHIAIASPWSWRGVIGPVASRDAIGSRDERSPEAADQLPGSSVATEGAPATQPTAMITPVNPRRADGLALSYGRREIACLFHEVGTPTNPMAGPGLRRFERDWIHRLM